MAGKAARKKGARASQGLSIKLRAAIFTTIALAVIAGAVALLRPASGEGDTTAVDATVRVDMNGFAPSSLSVKAGTPVSIRLVNPDSQFHSDGNGWHEFAIPQLGVDAKVAPKSEQIVTFTASTPGTYVFYCDVCCGGKENPSMQGTLKVTA